MRKWIEYIIVLIIGVSSFALSQSVAFKFPIIVRETGVGRDTIGIGVHPQATDCTDEFWMKNFSDYDSLKEIPLPPPPPPPAFDVRSSDPRGGPVDCYDNGLRWDIRPDTAKADTFLVPFRISGSPYGTLPIYLSWSPMLKYYCDSMKMKNDTLGKKLNVDMLKDTVAIIPNSSRPMSEVYIFLYGPKQPPSPPDPPVLSSPVDMSTDQPFSIAFSWQVAGDAFLYRLQISKDSLFSSSIIFDDTTSLTSMQVNGLAPGTKYFWRVRAIDWFGKGRYQASPFRFITMLLPPPLLLPAADDPNVPATSTFKWNSAISATRYHLQISKNPTFTQLVIDSVSLKDTSKLIGPLENCATYYWRVSATNSVAASVYSDARTLSIVKVVPKVPVLASPPPNTTGDTLNPVLSWTGDACADKFKLQVLMDTNSSTFIFDDIVTGTSYQLNALAQQTDYYWRVQAINNTTGSGQFSGYWKFTTILYSPVTPALVSPTNNNNTVPANAAFIWHRVPYTDTYQLQVSTLQSFATTVFNDSTITDTTQQIPGLIHCVKYYWRVRARNAAGKSDFSEIRALTIVEAIPGAPELVDPPNNKDTVDFLPTLKWRTTDACSKIFRFQVAKNRTFTGTLVANDTTRLTAMRIGPLEGMTDYYWHVKDSNATGESMYSDTFHFTTTRNTPPEVPTLLSPGNGQGDVLMTPTLSWNAAARAEVYRLQVARDSAFNVRVENDSTITATSKQVKPLQNSTLYYWRVRAKNSAGISPDYSSIWKFYTLFPPAPPPLVEPRYDTTKVAILPLFLWADGNGAVMYQLQVSENPKFITFVANDSGLNEMSWRITSLLKGDTKYYWRVRGINPAGAGEWSAVWHFTTTLTGSANWAVALTVKETGPASQTIYFGVNQSATNGIDLGLGELELPPPEFGMFDARFVGQSLGEGVWLDLRKFSRYSQVDTYTVRFQPGFGSYPMKLWWDSSFVRPICDSMLLTDTFGGSQVRVRMDRDSSVYVSSSSINTLWIIKWGAKPLDVKSIAGEVPKGFMLYQNYPNPFNPSTQIEFTTDRIAYIRITVYDVLGREINNLRNAAFTPGRYSVVWDGKSDRGVQMPSGVYYARMIAIGRSNDKSDNGQYVSSRRMLMLK